MIKAIVSIILILSLALLVAAGPYEDAAETAEKAYHDCIINKHQKKSTADCNKLRDEYMKAFVEYRNSDEYVGSDLEPVPSKQQTIDSLQYRVERLERRVEDLERGLDTLRSGK